MSDELRQALSAWLKGVRDLPLPDRERLVLRGSLLTASLVAGARAPADLDYVVLGEFQPKWVAALASRVSASQGMTLLDHHVIWAETESPGVRCFLRSRCGTAFQVDFAFGDPLSLPPPVQSVLGVPGVQTAAPEDLWAWKLHGLVEFGRGRWRAKDLYDLTRLLDVPLRQHTLPAAVELAFSSRNVPLDALADFMTRPGWGQASSSGRKWRTFLKKSGVQADLTACRELIRAQVRLVWPEREWPT